MRVAVLTVLALVGFAANSLLCRRMGEWEASLASKRRVLARMAVDCQGGSTALSRDGKRGLVRFWRGAVSMPVVGKPIFPEPFPSQAFRERLFLMVSLRTRGPYLLVSLADSGAHPQMYRGRKLAWSSETARAVTFWPK